MSTQRQTGEQRGSFSNNRPRQYKWGFAISRPKFNIRMNWAYQAKRKRGAVTGNSVPAETYNWDSKKMNIDLSMDYYFRKNMAVYAAFRNLNDATDDTQIYSEKLTPLNARFRQRNDYGSLWTMGIRSSF
jgi:predicted porin